MKQCDKDLLYRKVKVISEVRDTWYAVVNHNTFFAQEAAAGRHHPSLAFVLNVSNVRLKWLQTPSRPLKMVHRAARSCRVITPATTTSRPMTPTMTRVLGRVGAWLPPLTCPTATRIRGHIVGGSHGGVAPRKPGQTPRKTPPAHQTPFRPLIFAVLGRRCGRRVAIFFLFQDGIFIYSRRRAGGYIACLDPSRNTLLLTKRPFSHTRPKAQRCREAG